MPEAVAKKVTVARDGSLTNGLFYVVADGMGGVLMVPRPAMQKALDNHYRQLSFRDAAAPPTNNLGRVGKAAGFLPGDWPNKQAQDESADTSQGTQGSPAGSRERADRPPTPPSLRSGEFTVDLKGGIDTGQRQPSPYFAPSRIEEDGRNPTTNNDQDDPEDTGLGSVLGTFGPIPDNMVLQLQPLASGEIAVVCLPADQEDDTDFHTNDRTYRHRVRDGIDPILAKMNRRNRAYHTRDWSSTQRTTLYRYRPGEGSHLELQGPNAWGMFDLVLFISTNPQMNGPTPTGASGSAAEDNPGPGYDQAWLASPGERDHGVGNRDVHELSARISDSSPPLLAKINRMNASFWRKRA